LDNNVLFAAVHAGHPQHKKARAWLGRLRSASKPRPPRSDGILAVATTRSVALFGKSFDFMLGEPRCGSSQRQECRRSGIGCVTSVIGTNAIQQPPPKSGRSAGFQSCFLAHSSRLGGLRYGRTRAIGRRFSIRVFFVPFVSFCSKSVF
jgi:hypothetical protein